MDRHNKLQSIAGAVIFGIIGATALIGALFFGATHQFITAAIGAALSAVLGAEVARELKKAKQTTLKSH